jgi:cathepsin L
MKILPSLILGLATAETLEFHRLKTNVHSARLEQAVADHGHRFDNSAHTLINAWDKFKKMYNKVYHEVEQDMKKLEVWLENFAHIEDHNMLFAKGESTYALEMNEYGDMTVSEFLGVRNGFRMDLMEDRKKLAEEHIAINKVQGGTYMMPLNSEHSLPSKVDWRDHGFVTPVKNQGQCGSCWSFSATGALEGQMKRKTGTLPNLSEQNLVDCSRPEGNMGCNGGLMDQAFQYIHDQDGIDSEQSYEYEMRDDQPCRYKESNKAGDDVGFIDIPQFSESHLKHALATQGPVSIAIDAGNRSFQFYSHGVYYEPRCSSTQLDHGVLAVGYGDFKEEMPGSEEAKKEHTKYWLVKNSWGSEWGDEGYIRIARDADNHCGVATAASFPQV